MWKSALLTKAALMRFSTVRRLPATLYAPCTAAHPLAKALILQPGAGLIPGAKDHGGRSPKKIKIPSRKREERGGSPKLSGRWTWGNYYQPRVNLGYWRDAHGCMLGIAFSSDKKRNKMNKS